MKTSFESKASRRKYRFPVGLMLIGLVILGLIIAVMYIEKPKNYRDADPSIASLVIVTYRSNRTNSKSAKIAVTDSLATDFTKAFHLHGIRIHSAEFRYLSKEDDKFRCDNGVAIIGDYFQIIFSLEYPFECQTFSCKDGLITKLQYEIANQYHTMVLSEKVTNGNMRNILLNFCSFYINSTGEHKTGITKIVVNSLDSMGAYERLRGVAYGQLDPTSACNSIITDVQLAPRNKAGLVNYSMDFYILKPVKLSGGNRKIFFEVNNRGRKLFGKFAQISGGNSPSMVGDVERSFLLKQGYTIVWSGWDPSVPSTGDSNLLRIYVPIARNSDGTSVTGPVYEYIVFDNPISTSYMTSYHTSSTDTSTATLTVKYHLTDTPIAIPSMNWTWTSSNTIALLPLNTPFQQSAIYELTYTAKDPYVAGIGFAATRDFVSFLRSKRPDNPLAGGINRVISWGASQAARYMNDFLSLGFNQDCQGKQIFDGTFNWMGAGNGVGLNYRFAQPQRTERNRQDHLYPEAVFPFTYTILRDPLTGKIDGRNARCMRTRTCPKVMNVNSANDYWVKAASLLHSDLGGNDLPDPPNVRFYLISGTQHADPSPPGSQGICQQFGNTLDATPILRALFVTLDQWLDGIRPPPSLTPSRSNGTATFSDITHHSSLGIGRVSQRSLRWPTIPNVLYTGLITIRNLFNFGSNYSQGFLSINPVQSTGKYYSSFVSKVNEDGNEIAGIRLPPISVPVATYTGWNHRRNDYGGDDGCEAIGAVIPFAPDLATRMAKGDTRLSLVERYEDHDAYVAAVTVATTTLVNQRLLLPTDATTYINNAKLSIQIINHQTYGNYTW
ncbi:unnamed protein product [Adineta ricciae]|uniref:Alpha/beta hydrolase domain-containing protein n=1 Tax=Adineta ricciae TaxID=249248 RepID=A0A814SGJ9_ADIRI|nr:unnamed protein product [Adineta ricciae]CAF1145747.1 unnamed protein product [Adineta ricciae]